MHDADIEAEAVALAQKMATAAGKQTARVLARACYILLYSAMASVRDDRITRAAASLQEAADGR